MGRTVDLVGQVFPLLPELHNFSCPPLRSESTIFPAPRAWSRRPWVPTSGVNVMSCLSARPVNSRNGRRLVMIFFNEISVMITADHLRRRHGPGGNVRDIAFESSQLHRPLISLLFEGFVLVRDLGEPGLLRRLITHSCARYRPRLAP